MEHIINAYNGLRRYFNVLEQTGSYNKEGTYALAVYSFIVDQVFNGPLYQYLDDEGLNAFNKVLACLYRNGCLISKPEYVHLSDVREPKMSDVLLILEQNTMRITEADTVRRVE